MQKGVFFFLDRCFINSSSSLCCLGKLSRNLPLTSWDSHCIKLSILHQFPPGFLMHPTGTKNCISVIAGAAQFVHHAWYRKQKVLYYQQGVGCEWAGSGSSRGSRTGVGVQNGTDIEAHLFSKFMQFAVKVGMNMQLALLRVPPPPHSVNHCVHTGSALWYWFPSPARYRMPWWKPILEMDSLSGISFVLPKRSI